MPLLKLTINIEIDASKKSSLVKQLSSLLADTTGKPEQYVMVVLEQGTVLIAGKEGPAAFVDVKGIGGLDRKTNEQISSRVCELLNKTLSIDPQRVYMNFTDMKAENWGWNGGVF